MTRYANSDQYIITCEGETEVWYFDHLKKLINGVSNKPKMSVSPIREVNPAKLAKTIGSLYKRNWYHILDKETCRDSDEKTFENRILDFKKIEKFNKNIKTVLGYSNVSFELWLMLHKSDNTPTVHCAKDYWKDIKRIYKLHNVECFDDYKSEHNFNKVLNQITFEDVKRAIKKAEDIENINNREGIPRINGFRYFENNPSLSIHHVVRKILEDSELI